MTAGDVVRELEERGFRVTSRDGSEIEAVYGGITIHTYESVSGWWVVDDQERKPHRVALYAHPETRVEALSDWLRDIMKASAA